MGFACAGTAPSPLRGAKEGNIEFLSAFTYVDPSAGVGAAPEGDDDSDDGDGEGAVVGGAASGGAPNGL